MSDNRRIRVFVSSTFRDMVEERNELMTQPWPELRRFCRERQVELVEVDLRWALPRNRARVRRPSSSASTRSAPVARSSSGSLASGTSAGQTTLPGFTAARRETAGRWSLSATPAAVSRRW